MVGVSERSDAMIAGPRPAVERERRDPAIRPWRIGTRSAIRPLSFSAPMNVERILPHLAACRRGPRAGRRLVVPCPTRVTRALAARDGIAAPPLLPVLLASAHVVINIYGVRATARASRLGAVNRSLRSG